MKSVEKVLVIRHGALGDFCMATGAMKAIRESYPQAHIVLMTQNFLVDLGRRLGFFDEIVIDNRSRSPFAILATLSRIARGGYDLVYDLQGTHRTRRTYRFGARLFGYRGRWIAVGDASFDIGFPPPDISQIHGEGKVAGSLPKRYAVLIPGCSPTNPEKRWPAENYRALALWLGERGMTSVVIGTKAEAKEIETICRDNPHAVDFMGKSQLVDIPDLARGAEIVIGNDTGPTHMCRLAGARTLLLLPAYSAHLAGKAKRRRTLISERVEKIGIEEARSSAAELLEEEEV